MNTKTKFDLPDTIPSTMDDVEPDDLVWQFDDSTPLFNERLLKLLLLQNNIDEESVDKLIKLTCMC